MIFLASLQRKWAVARFQNAKHFFLSFTSRPVSRVPFRYNWRIQFQRFLTPFLRLTRDSSATELARMRLKRRRNRSGSVEARHGNKLLADRYIRDECRVCTGVYTNTFTARNSLLDLPCRAAQYTIVASFSTAIKSSQWNDLKGRRPQNTFRTSN